MLAQFAMGFFFIIDVASFSHSPRNGSDVHIKFVDWIPFIFSTIGMLVINSIEKSRLQADSFSYSGSGVAWKARFVLFLGFAMLAGGLAGSVVQFLSLLSSFFIYTLSYILTDCISWTPGERPGERPSCTAFVRFFVPQARFPALCSVPWIFLEAGLHLRSTRLDAASCDVLLLVRLEGIRTVSSF